jgi:hypothetical protein
MALALDGSVHGNSGGASSLAVSLTTTNTNDIICVVVLTNGGPVTSVSSTHVTFTQKSTATANAGNQTIELWVGTASVILTAESITINTTTSAFLTIDAFGISGANTSSPYDGSPVIHSGFIADPLTISTTNANDIVLGMYRQNSQSTPTQGTGWTKISGADFQLCEYQIFTSTQSGLSVTIGTGASDSNAGIAVAIEASGAVFLWSQLVDLIVLPKGHTVREMVRHD